MQLEQIIIVKSERETTSDNETMLSTYSSFDRKDAWKWLRDDIADECSDHDWKNIKVRLKDIEPGKYFRSPEDDPDHEYVWKVIIQTVNV